MQVKLGGTEFVRTKFDGLDGLTTVAYTTADDLIQGRATRAGVRFKIDAEATGFEEAERLVHTLGSLFDSCWKEHLNLRPQLTRTVTGH